MYFKRFLLIYMVLCIAFSGMVFADEVDVSTLYDDCVDFQKAVGYSENIFAYTVPEEDYYAYDTDYTMFRRSSNTREWLTYEIKSNTYPVFYTYFRYTDNIPHFEFEQSADGEIWTEATPSMKIREVENWKWIPVEYSLKNLDESSKYVKIIYSDKSEYDWSPMISGVEYRYKTIEGGFYDCLGLDCESSVNKLYTLGFINGYNEYEFCPENNVTRAEFAKLNAGILGLSVSGRAERVFNDVLSDYWAAAPIASLYRMGVINGDEKGNFNPEANVTYAEAEKMLVVSLGYSIYAENEGGYPSGYSLVANRLKLNKGIEETDKNAYLTRGDAAIMMDNALSAELIYQTSFGSDADFEKSDKTLLDIYFDINQVEGIVDSANGMGITDGISREIDLAVIDGIKYDTEYDLSHLLGKNVKGYIKDDKLIYAESYNCEVTEISADDFVCIDDNEFIYEDNGDKSLKVSDNTRIVVNGEYETRIGVNPSLDGISGFMRLIDNDGGEVDTILVNSYESYVSAGDFKLADAITVKGSQSIKIDLKKAVNVKVTVYGEEVNYKEAKVHKNDVIYIAKSKSGDIIDVVVAGNSSAGDVTYKDSEVVVVGGKEYKLADNFSAISGDMTVGSSSVIYTDVNGNIFASESASSFEYAYLLNVSEADIFGDKVNLRLISNQGEILEVKADDKTSLNGNKKAISRIENISPQLVRIKRDNSILKSIETANENLGTVGESDFTVNYRADASKYYGGNISAFGSIYQVGASTPVFVIPEDENDIKKYKVTDRGIFITDREYKVDIYDMSDEYRAGAVVVSMAESSKRTVEPYDNVAVIRKSSVITNAEGDKCLKLYVYIKGEEQYVYFDNLGGDDLTGSWLPSYEARDTKDGNNPFSAGEVIQYYSDSESHCKSFKMLLTNELTENNVLYENNTGDYGKITDENYFSELYTATGIVKERFSDKLLISAYADGKRVRTIPTAGSSIYVFNQDKKELKLGDMSDVSVDSYVFVRMNYDSTIDIIVIKGE